jgi:hypothetical protein
LWLSACLRNARIILEDLKGIWRSVNRRVRKPYNGKLQPTSVHSKLPKRRALEEEVKSRKLNRTSPRLGDNEYEEA